MRYTPSLALILATISFAPPVLAADRPVLDGEAVYVGGEDGVLRALDRASGELVWEYEAGAAIGSRAGLDEAREDTVELGAEAG